VGKISESIL